VSKQPYEKYQTGRKTTSLGLKLDLSDIAVKGHCRRSMKMLMTCIDSTEAGGIISAKVDQNITQENY